MKHHQSGGVFRSRFGMQVERLHNVLKPAGIAVCELQFQNDQISENRNRFEGFVGIPDLMLDGGCDMTVECDSDIVRPIALIGFPHVGDMGSGRRIELVPKMAEILERGKLFRRAHEQMIEDGGMSGDQFLDRFAMHDGAALRDDLIVATLHFQINWLPFAIVIIPDAQFETVPVSVHRVAIGIEVGRVEVDAMNGVRKVGLGCAEAVHIQIGFHKLPNLKRRMFGCQILVFESLTLERFV